MENQTFILKQLRDQTGAGMLECKNALVEGNWDLETAKELLRKKGIGKATDRNSSRVAADGAVHSYVTPDGSIGVLLEVNCETDFAARGFAFKALVAHLAERIVITAPDTVAEFTADPEVANMLLKASVAIKEKIVVRRFEMFDVMG